MRLLLGCFLCLWIGFSNSKLLAQADSSAAKPFKKSTFSALPVVFYTPETRLAFGGAGVYAFRKDSLQKYPSQVQLGLAYTLNNQLLVYLPYRIYLKDEQYLLYGELGYYIYNYFFYGVGNDQDPNYEELYGVDFTRIRFNLLKKVQKNLYLGLRYWFEDFKITETEEGLQLSTGEIAGSRGGLSSGLGLIANYDTRDNLFYPSKGVFVESTLHWNNEAILSDFNYTRYLIDAATYFSWKKDHVFALNGVMDFISGNPPFNQMALLGGTRRMRGFYEGRFRDSNALIFQAEYRFPLFWRLGGAIFANYGGVANAIHDFQISNFRYTAGGGLRFILNREEHINIRFDVGVGKNTSGFYFTIGEAF